LNIKLKDILDSQNKSIYALSKATGISQNNLSKLVNGETISIRYDSLEKICKVLKITPNDIFEIDYSED
jgi:putative transcriptional regulator